MRTGLLSLLGLSLCSASLAAAQAGSAVDLHVNQRELQRYQWQLQQDRNRLVFDLRHHASKAQIREDRAQIRRDKATLKTIRSDIQRDRQLRQRHRAL
ncbi:MAG: hypothetical protein ACM3SW_18440 [Actinomycetota bacterium]